MAVWIYSRNLGKYSQQTGAIMKIVIAGATGFIGQNLIAQLLGSRHSIVILTRRPFSTKANQDPLLTYASWDGTSQGSWAKHLDGADAVINLSGQSIAGKRWSTTRKLELLSSRIDSTKAIVCAIQNAGIKPSALLNASAVGYYGHTQEGDVNEDHPAGSDYLGRLCAQWELAALAAEQLGVRVLLLRSGIVLDSRSGALPRMLLPFKLFVGGPLGSGRQWFPWIHRDDEIRGIVYALEHSSLSGPVNLVAPEEATMRDFSIALGKAMHRPSALAVPSFLLRILLGEMADVILTGQRAVPEKLIQAGFQFRFPALAEALADLLQEHGNSVGSS